jgi:hypothetical protein
MKRQSTKKNARHDINQSSFGRRGLTTVVVTLTALLLGFGGGTATATQHSTHHTLSPTSGEKDFVTAARSAGGPQLRRTARAGLLRIGRAICREYKNEGYAGWVTAAINKGLRDGGLSKSQARGVSLAARTYLCPATGQADTPQGSPSTTPAPQPLPSPTPTPTKLQLPDNSGWEITTNQFSGSQYLRANADAGKVLPLGNAAALGLSFYGSTCSGEWYESAFVGIEFLDSSGNVIANKFGRSPELLGYLAGNSDFSSAGCGGESVKLSEWPGVAAARIVSNSGSSGTVALFGSNYL